MRLWAIAALIAGAGCVETSSGAGPADGRTPVDPCGNESLDDGEDCDGVLRRDRDATATCTSKCLYNRCGDREVLDGENCDGSQDCPDDCNLAQCRDGDVDEDEECDPLAGLGPCSNECKLCGNGQLDPGESCDVAEGGYCFLDCESFCGDRARSELEACDEGATHPSGSSCDSSCRERRCGDGVVSDSEACDGGPGCGGECRFLDCRARDMSMGWNQLFALVGDGALLSTGLDDNGALGRPDGPGEATGTPELREGQPLWRVVGGQEVALGIDADGGLWSWGSNRLGGLGVGDLEPRAGRNRVLVPRPVVDAALTMTTAAAVDVDGAIWVWGSDASELLADGEEAARAQACGADRTGCWQERRVGTPRKIDAEGTRFRSVAGVTQTFVAISEGGSLWGWGRNLEQQLGNLELPSSCRDGFDGEITCSAKPRQIVAGPVDHVAPGGNVTLWSEGTRLFAMGHLVFVGGPDEKRGVPWELPRPEGAPDVGYITLTFGEYHGFALRADGVLLGLGVNSEGMLGLGTIEPGGTRGLTEVPLPGEVRKVAATFRSSAALLADGRIFAFGSGEHGRFGDGEIAPHSVATPFEVPLVCP